MWRAFNLLPGTRKYPFSKAESVRRAIENTREKALKEKTAKEHFRPLTLVHKQELEKVLNGIGGTMKNIAS